MKRLDVVLLRTAISDLVKIEDDVFKASRSVRTAARFSDRLYAKCQKVGDHPYAARPRPELMHGLRMVPFEKRAMIAYTIEDDVVRISNIFWAGQNYDAFYLDDDEQG